MNPLAVSLSLLALAGWAGCALDSDGNQPSVPDRDYRSEVTANRKKWEEARPAKFGYTLKRSCFCVSDWVGPFLVVATPDSVISARRIVTRYYSSAETLTVVDRLQELSIPSVFDFVGDLLDDKNDSEAATFDSVYGFPDSVSVDRIRNAIDDEMSIQITDFRPLIGD